MAVRVLQLRVKQAGVKRAGAAGRWRVFASIIALFVASGCARFGYDSLALQDTPATGGSSGGLGGAIFTGSAGLNAGGAGSGAGAAGAAGNNAGGAADVLPVPDPASCPTPCVNAHGTASCSTGSCVVACELGYADCDGDATNGCEVSTAATTAACGGCGVSCTNIHGVTQCQSSLCAPTCDPGYADCDQDPLNGCEQPLDTLADCGDCAVACSETNATTACLGGACSPTCASGFGDCDGNPGNGCEADLDNDPTRCGSCSFACGTSGQICVAGTCQASPCSPGFGECDGDLGVTCETSTDTSLQNCGFCSNACSVDNGTPTCSAGDCAIGGCDSGFGDCDALASNGCEVPLATTAAHCGGCGSACVNPNGNTSCSGSSCAPTCSTGFGDCDASRQNGCETALDGVNNCGGCGNVCPANGGTPICNAGLCDTLCDLSGTFALKMTMTGSWPAVANVRSGGGTFFFWLKATTTHVGNSVAATVTECGRVMPEIVADMVVGADEPLIHGYTNGPFDSGLLPSSAAAVTLNRSSPGATLSWPLTANQLGIAMTNPKTDAWPSATSGIPAGQRVDMDGDGKPGVTGTYATGATFPRTSAAFFGGNRADLPYYAARLRFSLNGSLSSCSASSGTATVTSTDLRIYGCNRSGSAQDCDATEGAFVDANTPTVVSGPASYVLERVANGAGCAAVRAAIP